MRIIEMPLNPNAPEFKPSNHSKKSTRKSSKNVWKSLGKKLEGNKKDKRSDNNNMNDYLKQIARLRRNLSNKNRTN